MKERKRCPVSSRRKGNSALKERKKFSDGYGCCSLNQCPPHPRPNSFSLSLSLSSKVNWWLITASSCLCTACQPACPSTHLQINAKIDYDSCSVAAAVAAYYAAAATATTKTLQAAKDGHCLSLCVCVCLCEPQWSPSRARHSLNVTRVVAKRVQLADKWCRQFAAAAVC